MLGVNMPALTPPGALEFGIGHNGINPADGPKLRLMGFKSAAILPSLHLKVSGLLHVCIRAVALGASHSQESTIVDKACLQITKYKS